MLHTPIVGTRQGVASVERTCLVCLREASARLNQRLHLGFEKVSGSMKWRSFSASP